MARSYCLYTGKGKGLSCVRWMDGDKYIKITRATVVWAGVFQHHMLSFRGVA